MSTRNLLGFAFADKTFKVSGGTAVWDPHSTAYGHGRVSAAIDLGDLKSAARPTRYRWRCQMQWVDANTINDQFRLYLVTSNAPATPGATDGGITFGDADVTSEQEYITNCLPIEPVICSGANVQESKSGVVELLDQYVAVMGWNGSAAKALHATTTLFVFTLTPIIDQIQAEV